MPSENHIAVFGTADRSRDHYLRNFVFILFFFTSENKNHIFGKGIDMLTQQEIERRKPLWQDLSELWKDTELLDHELSYIAEKMRFSNYSLEEIEKILAEEVAPVVYGNLLGFGASWTGFDAEWLYREIIENLKKQERSPLHRIWIKSRAGKFVMTRMIQDKWKKTVELYKLSEPSQCNTITFVIFNHAE